MAIALAALILAGCGGDDKNSATTTQAKERAAEQKRLTVEKAPRSRRDAEVERNLEAHLREEAPFASGWTFADVRAVKTRGRQVVVETRLKPREREAASSLCLAVREFFQGQEASSVIVSGRGDLTLVEC